MRTIMSQVIYGLDLTGKKVALCTVNGYQLLSESVKPICLMYRLLYVCIYFIENND